jgi:hypothetical protein
VFKGIYIGQLGSLAIGQMGDRAGIVAHSTGGSSQGNFQVTQEQAMSETGKGGGADFEATASQGGVQENFSNEGDGARFKATANGATQRGFVNKSGGSPATQPPPQSDARKGWIHSPGGIAILGLVGAVLCALIGGYFLLKSSEKGKEVVVAPSSSLLDAGVNADRPQP